MCVCPFVAGIWKTSRNTPSEHSTWLRDGNSNRTNVTPRPTPRWVLIKQELHDLRSNANSWKKLCVRNIVTMLLCIVSYMSTGCNNDRRPNGRCPAIIHHKTSKTRTFHSMIHIPWTILNIHHQRLKNHHRSVRARYQSDPGLDALNTSIEQMRDTRILFDMSMNGVPDRRSSWWKSVNI